MKTISLFTILMLVGSIAVSQTITKNDQGIYINTMGELYTGIYKAYYENGNIKLESNLKDGLKNGISKTYFEDGTLHEVHSYKNDLMDGLWITYNKEQIKTAEANYAKDKKNGLWKVWDENGTLVYVMHYTNDKNIELEWQGMSWHVMSICFMSEKG